MVKQCKTEGFTLTQQSTQEEKYNCHSHLFSRLINCYLKLFNGRSITRFLDCADIIWDKNELFLSRRSWTEPQKYKEMMSTAVSQLQPRNCVSLVQIVSDFTSVVQCILYQNKQWELTANYFDEGCLKWIWHIAMKLTRHRALHTHVLMPPVSVTKRGKLYADMV